MAPDVVLCIDSKTKTNPKLINLENENFNQTWLKVFSNAVEFRRYINTHKEKFEIWVVSSDDIDAINLAATAKKDRQDCVVCLISFSLTGSLKSRATAANVDSIINLESLKERFVAKSTANEHVSASQTNEFKLRHIPNVNTSMQNNKKAFVLSVVSASGGTGKSSVSAMAGLLAHTAGFKTLIIDADFQFGNIDSMFNITTPITFEKYIEDNNLFLNYHQNENNPMVLSPPEFPELSEKMINEFPAALESLKQQFDVIIINTGSYWNEIQAVMLERDSKSLFLIDQRPSSILATKKAIELCNRCGIATGSVIYGINKCSKHALFSSLDVSCTLQGAQVAEIMDGGLDVDELLSQGKPIELIKSQNSFAVSIWSILSGILPQYVSDNDKTKKIELKNSNPSFRTGHNSSISKLFRKRA